MFGRREELHGAMNAHIRNSGNDQRPPLLAGFCVGGKHGEQSVDFSRFPRQTFQPGKGGWVGLRLLAVAYDKAVAGGVVRDCEACAT